MATKKFSDLPAASTLDGTEIFAITQSGTSVQEDLSTMKVHILQVGDVAGKLVSLAVNKTLDSGYALDVGGISKFVGNSGEGVPSFTGSEVAIFQRNPDSSGIALITVLGGSAGAAWITFGDKDSSTIGSIRYSNSNNGMTLWSNGSEFLRGDSSQRVYIGYGNSGVTPSAVADNLILESTSGNDLGMSFLAGADSDAIQIYMGSPSDSTSARIKWQYSDTILRIGTLNAIGQVGLYSGNNVEAMRIDSSQNVGIGTTSPDSRLHVYGATPNIIAQNNSTSGSATASLTLWAHNSSTNYKTEIAGIRDGSSNGTSMVFYTHPNVSGAALAEAMRITNNQYALIGLTANVSSDLLQVNGNISMRGSSDVDRYLKFASDASIMWDESANILKTDKGLYVGGALSKASGSFKITHPLDSKRKLVHSFIEGPRADLIYRGKVQFNDSDLIIVNIDKDSSNSGMTDGTFEVLCRNIQSFTTNETGWTRVTSDIVNGELHIQAEELCNDTISWMVIGERNDTHMYETDWTDGNGYVITEPLVG